MTVGSLLVLERNDLRIERNFFENNPKLGRLVHNPLLPAALNPLKISDRARELLLERWSTSPDNNFLSAINQIDRMMKSKSNGHAIYVHCEAGRDRTGAVIASYRMMFEGYYSDKTYDSIEEYKTPSCETCGSD